MYENEAAIATQLASILASQRKKAFTKEIIVSDSCGGDIDVSVSQVIIHPFFLTEGNPVAVMNHVLDVSEEYDRMRERRTLSAIIDLKHKLRFCLRELSRLDPDSIQSIVEEELGLGADTLLVLEELPTPREGR